MSFRDGFAPDCTHRQPTRRARRPLRSVAMIRTLGVLAAIAALACATVQVSVDYDPAEDFSAFRTFAWLPEGPHEGDPRVSGLVESRIRRAVDATLAGRGYRKVLDGTPDFYVTYHVSIEDRLDVTTINRGYVDRWGYVVALPETHVSQYEEGTLAIDVLDAHQHELVWRGVARGRLRRDPSPEQVTRRVNEVVGEILGRFPPGA